MVDSCAVEKPAEPVIRTFRPLRNLLSVVTASDRRERGNLSWRNDGLRERTRKKVFFNRLTGTCFATDKSEIGNAAVLRKALEDVILSAARNLKSEKLAIQGAFDSIR